MEGLAADCCLIRMSRVVLYPVGALVYFNFPTINAPQGGYSQFCYFSPTNAGGTWGFSLINPSTPWQPGDLSYGDGYLTLGSSGDNGWNCAPFSSTNYFPLPQYLYLNTTMRANGILAYYSNQAETWGEIYGYQLAGYVPYLEAIICSLLFSSSSSFPTDSLVGGGWNEKMITPKSQDRPLLQPAILVRVRSFLSIGHNHSASDSLIRCPTMW